MNILHSFEELHLIKEPKVYALGTFDGIHKGHQSVITKAVATANIDGAVSIIVTFDKHPLSILNPQKVPAILLDHKMMEQVVAQMNVDYILSLPVTESFLAMEAEEFLHKLCDSLDVRAIVVGENFTFGAKGLGTPSFMCGQLVSMKIKVLIQPLMPSEVDSKPVSSTMIRDAIKEGKMELATNLLGRPYEFIGTVIKGDQRGRTLGFPTLNFKLSAEMATPPDGVYANRVCIDGVWYDGVGNIGDNPTFENQYHRCEVYVFDFDQDVYGKEVIVQFISYLRGEVKFNNLQDLIDQMKIDEEQALTILRGAHTE